MSSQIAVAFSVTFLRLTVDASVKAILLLVVVGVVLRLARSMPASTHATVLAWVAASLTLLPLLSAVEPAWNLSLLPDIGASSESMTVRGTVERTDMADLAEPGAGNADLRGEAAAAGHPRWPLWIMLAWAVGLAAYLAWLLAGRLGLWWIHRHALQLRNERWTALIQAVSDAMGLRLRVPVYTSKVIHMAVTTGVFSPRVILPSQAHDWPEERLQMVLIHELAHIRRRDSLVELVARAATAMHWFNPLVWLAMRQLRIERERACDNEVLQSGAKPSDYAAQLMEAAAELGAFNHPLWQTAATSEGSSLKDRLLCILDPKLRRGSAPPYSPILTAMVTIVLVAPLAAVSVWFDQDNRGVARPEKTPAVRESTRPETTPSPRQSPLGPTGGLAKAQPTPATTEVPRAPTEAKPTEKTDERTPPPGGIPRQSRIARLTRDLDSPDQQVRISAAVALKEMRRRDTIPALLEALDDSYDEVRIVAVVALGALDDPRATEGLRRALDDPTERIRVEAVVELGKRRTRAAYDALLEASRNSSWPVRDAARAALERIECDADAEKGANQSPRH